VFCRFCGTAIPRQFRFCPKCGKDQAASAEPQQTVQPTAPLQHDGGHRLKLGCLIVAVGLSLLGVVLVLLSPDSNRRAGPSVAPAPNDQKQPPANKLSLGVGSEALLYSPELDTLPVAIDDLSFQLAVRSAAANDGIGLGELAASGRVLDARSGTPALVLDQREMAFDQYRIKAVKVRLLAGRHFTEAGWVLSKWLTVISSETVRSLPMSRQETLRTYSPEPELLRTVTDPDGTTVYLYRSRGHMLELTERAGKLVRAAMICQESEVKSSVDAGLACVVNAALFCMEFAGFSVTPPENAKRLGLSNAYDPVPSELTCHGVRLRRYVSRDRLVFEATPQSASTLSSAEP